MIVGITGTLGAGKGTIVEYLVREHGFRHYSVRAFITEEIKRRALPVNRDNMREVANDLRAAHSPSYIVEQLYQQALAAGGDAVIESLRTTGEVTALRKKPDFHLFAVDCPIKLRYQRIKARRSETDMVDFETFVANEAAEMHGTDPGTQNLAACIRLADHFFKNDGSISELEQAVGEAINAIRHNRQA